MPSALCPMLYNPKLSTKKIDNFTAVYYRKEHNNRFYPVDGTIQQKKFILTYPLGYAILKNNQSFHRVTRMKQLILLLFLIIISLLSTNRALSQDNQKENTKNDYNIVLITIDTLRADHLSCYGYERSTTPNIDKIAEQGIIYKNAIAPSSWTVPSMVSLFTSVYPINHGTIHGFAKTGKVFDQEVFSDELTTLTEILKVHGYTTFGVTSNLHLSGKFGFARGFDYFKALPFSSAPSVNKIISSWENKIKNSDKYFLWIHYFDPHDPYYSKPPWTAKYTPNASTKNLLLSNKMMTELSVLIPSLKKDPQAIHDLTALYDSEINYVDASIGSLIEKLKLGNDSLLIITSDHGEEFLEHGQLGHGNNVHRETIHIPLIVKLPYENEKEIVEKHVNLIDIMPTILQITNINPPEHILGKSFLEKKGLFAWIKKKLQGEGKPDYNFSELNRKLILKTIVTPQWKYIFSYRDKTDQLYNITSDPLELNNLAGENIKQRNQLKEELFEWVSNSKKYPVKRQPAQLSPQEKEKLKGLGYIE